MPRIKSRAGADTSAFQLPSSITGGSTQRAADQALTRRANAFFEIDLDQGANQRAADISSRSATASPTVGPTRPGGEQASSLVDQVSNAFSSTIQTGSPNPQMATLINPQTGERTDPPVIVGSEQAQQLFAQGYVLEGSPGTPSAGARSATTGRVFSGSENVLATLEASTQPDPFKQAQTRLSFLQNQKEQLRQQAFASTYSYSPEEWENLSPAAQRRLRNQRVQGLLGAVGNVDLAISQIETELKTQKTEAVDAINFYLNNGALGLIDDEKLSQLAANAGLDASALRGISDPELEWELKQLGSDLVAVKFDSGTGDMEKKTLHTSGSGSSGGGGKSKGKTTVGDSAIQYPDEFADWYNVVSNSQQTLGGIIGETEGGPVNPNNAAVVSQAYEHWINNIGSELVFGEQKEQKFDTNVFKAEVNEILGAVGTGELEVQVAYDALVDKYGGQKQDILTAFISNGYQVTP